MQMNAFLTLAFAAKSAILVALARTFLIPYTDTHLRAKLLSFLSWEADGDCSCTQDENRQGISLVFFLFIDLEPLAGQTSRCFIVGDVHLSYRIRFHIFCTMNAYLQFIPALYQCRARSWSSDVHVFLSHFHWLLFLSASSLGLSWSLRERQVHRLEVNEKLKIIVVEMRNSEILFQLIAHSRTGGSLLGDWRRTKSCWFLDTLPNSFS